MKKHAVSTLIKDLILVAIFAAIGTAILSDLSGFTTNTILESILLFGGIPLGWRWASHFITAVSLQGIGIKLLISLFLGWLALFVVLIGDIIRILRAPSAQALA